MEDVGESKCSLKVESNNGKSTRVKAWRITISARVKTEAPSQREITYCGETDGQAIHSF
jgi:hypothetical protein